MHREGHSADGGRRATKGFVEMKLPEYVYEKSLRLNEGCFWFKEVILAIDILGF